MIKKPENPQSPGLRSPGADNITVPWDLGQWFDRKLLLDWVTMEVESLDWSNPRLVEFLRLNPKFRPKTLLVAIVWCYAIGVFDSDAIAEMGLQDPALRERFGEAPPSGRAVGRFRRENRGLLKWCLAQVFKRVFRARFELGGTMLPAGLKRYLEEAAILRLDLARQVDRGSSGF